jgi:hypothetical protein
MESKLSKIMKCSNLAEPEYPKLGQPLEFLSVRSKSKKETLWQGHVVMGIGSGIFLDLGFDSESRALEYSANYLLEIRTNNRLLGIF